MARRRDIYDKVKEIAEIYLLEHVGERAVIGWPHFDDDRQIWIVTVLCETPRGVVPAGRIELGRKLNLIYATPRDEMARAVEEHLRRRLHLVFGDENELKAKGIDVVTF